MQIAIELSSQPLVKNHAAMLGRRRKSKRCMLLPNFHTSEYKSGYLVLSVKNVLLLKNFLIRSFAIMFLIRLEL